MARARLRRLWGSAGVRLVTSGGRTRLNDAVRAVGLFSRLVWWSYDTHQRALADAVDLSDVLVVDIDEASFARLAPAIVQAQNERALLARLGAFLQESGAKAVGYHCRSANPPGRPGVRVDRRPDIVVAAVGLPVPQPDNAG